MIYQIFKLPTFDYHSKYNFNCSRNVKLLMIKMNGMIHFNLQAVNHAVFFLLQKEIYKNINKNI